jgi:HSP20 family protein
MQEKAMMYSRFGHVRNDIENVVEQIGEQLGNFFEQVRKETPFTNEGPQAHVFSPRIDVEEDNTNVYIYAELPGMEKSDIKVTLNEERVLTIKGEKKKTEGNPDVKRAQNERSFGSFTRSITLSEQVNTQSVNAEFTNGVLKITVAKNAEDDKEISVEIK